MVLNISLCSLDIRHALQIEHQKSDRATTEGWTDDMMKQI